MTSVLNKPADRIDAGDIQALIDECVPESAQIEFKESLPAGKGKTDAWLNGGSGIGDYARNRILEEVVAFANAYGGALVLGVAESRTKPPVAAAVTPLPRCAELAERFRQVFGACVDPPLPTLDIVSVPMGGDSGVIVFRTGRSRRGPHRVKPTLECPVRRDDRCEALSMREIQDMTLNLARGTERLERRLRERAERFKDEFKRLKTPKDAFGYCLTAIPVGEEIQVESVFSGNSLAEELRPPDIKVKRNINDEITFLRTAQERYNLSPKDWRVMLRASRAEAVRFHPEKLQQCSYAEVCTDGFLEIGFLATRQYSYVYGGIEVSNDEVDEIDMDFPISIFAQLLVWADQFRIQANAPGAEYVFRIKLMITAERMYPSGGHLLGYLPNIGRQDTSFPLYYMGESGKMTDIVLLFERDFHNNFGGNINQSQGALEFVQK